MDYQKVVDMHITIVIAGLSALEKTDVLFRGLKDLRIKQVLDMIKEISVRLLIKGIQQAMIAIIIMVYHRCYVFNGECFLEWLNF